LNIELTITLPGRPMLPNRRRTLHWSVQAKENRMWRDAVVWSVRATMGPGWPSEPFQKATVDFMCFRSGMQPDHDNLVASIKPILDGLQPPRIVQKLSGPISIAGSGVIADDTFACIGAPTVTWQPSKRIDDRVVVTVREEESDADPVDD